jgi:hypothetical protein
MVTRRALDFHLVPALFLSVLVAVGAVTLTSTPGAHAASPCSVPTAGVVVDNDCDGIDDHLEQQLANRFAPVILIESDESNYPVNVEWFLQRARMEYHEDCTGDIDDPIGPDPLVTQANLIGPPWSASAHCGEDDTGYGSPPHRDITTIAADPDGQISDGAASTGYSDQQTFVLPDLPDEDHVGSLNPVDWKTYFHAYPTKGGGVMLQYWHLFAYNELGIAGFGDHGGDWDATIHVQLGPDLDVDTVWFSRHGDDHPGTPFPADQVTYIDGTHTLMTIDGGGHAAFASPSDFCNNGSFAGGSAVWPSDMTDPLNPYKLGTIPCGDDHPGGTVWETWDGGSVESSDNLTHELPLSSGHGGMVDLGEYNPCTPIACNGSRQGSTLLAGEFHPLNDQIFIRYEGRWGSLPTCGGLCANPPRGPVFQGVDDTGNEVIYTAWYNWGADVPASPATSPWRQPPSTTRTITGPTYTAGGTTYVSPSTSLSLSATQNAIAAVFGAVHTYYRAYHLGLGAAPDYQEYTGPFSLQAVDGDYQIDYYSVDALDNQEELHSLQVTLDSTPPTVTIVQPTAGDYPHSATLTLDYSTIDNGSGLASVTPTMDGSATLAGHGLASGQAVHLLTELTLGQHTFTVDAADHVGNVGSRSVTFSIIVTAQSVQDDVTQFEASGDVSATEATSLLKKLQAAAAARARGDCAPAANVYQAFIEELEAQTGKEVSPTAASIMIADAQYLISHCP